MKSIILPLLLLLVIVLPFSAQASTLENLFQTIISLQQQIIQLLTNQKSSVTPAKAVCTKELKICSDGTSVSRQGSKCEFAKCPEVSSNRSIYKGLGFQIKYPSDVFSLISDVSVPEDLPPVNGKVYKRTKLIAKNHLSLLGKKECFYGEMGKKEVCSAFKESGIEITTAFGYSVKELIAGYPTKPTKIAGYAAYKYDAGVEGEGIETYYISLDRSDKNSLIISRHYDITGFPDKKIFEQVVSSLLIEGKY